VTLSSNLYFLHSLHAFYLLQLNVVRGSGRFIPNPPFSSYMYGRIIKRDEVRSQAAQAQFGLDETRERLVQRSVRGFEEFILWEQYLMNLPPPPHALPFFA